MMNSKAAIILAAGLLMSAAACEKEDPTESAEPVTTVNLRLLLEERAGTKAVPAVNAVAVTDVNIFIYNCTTGHLMDYAYIEDPGESLELGISSGGTYSVYVTANSGDLTESPGISDSTGLMAMTWDLQTPGDIVNASGAIPMSGRVTGIRIEDGSSLSIPLTRMLSRFRIIADTSGLDSDISTFRIHKVMLRNMNRKVSYFSRGSRAVTADDVFAEGLSIEGDGLEKIFSGGVDFYLPENAQGDLLSSNVDESSHIPPDPYGDLCTFVELHVDYRSPEHYSDSLVYRYYLHDGQRLDNFDVLRNTMYTCRTRFTGSGINEESWRIDVSGMKDLVTSISVSPESRTFRDAGEEYRYTATVLPLSAENPEVSWSSDDEDVAVVAPDGTVTAVSDGSCIITATAVDGSGVSGSARVKVDTYKFPTSVTVSPEQADMYTGDELTLSAEVLPENANDKGVTWVSSDTGTATVSDNGTVTAVKSGEVRIIVSTKANSLKDTAFITIKDKSFKLGDMPDILYPGYNAPIEIPFTSVPAAEPSLSLTVNSGHESGAAVSGNRITVSNPGVQSGVIGTYTLKGTANGITDTHEFTVSAGKISLQDRISTMYPGNSVKLVPQELSPSDIGITWSSSDPAVADVKNDGTVTPAAPGKCRITASTDAGAYDWADITVSMPVLSIDSHMDIYEGESVTLECTTIPASDYPLEYTVISGNEHIRISGGNTLQGIKNTSGKADAVIEVRYRDFPDIYQRAAVTVHSCLSASLMNGNRVVCTVGHSSDGSNWGNAVTFLRVKVNRAPHIRIQWSVVDEEGVPRPGYFRISESAGICIVSPVSTNANGKFYITGWDQTGTYSTDTFEIHSYQMLEYEVGLSEWSLYSNGNQNYYTVSMSARWRTNSWNVMNGELKNAITGIRLITHLSSSTDFQTVGSPDSEQIYIRGYQTNILRSGMGVINDLKRLIPKSWIRSGFGSSPQPTKGVNGVYLILNVQEHGADGYYFIRQKNEIFYNSEEYSG